MRYIWQANHPEQVFHIEKYTATGEGTMQALCGQDNRFDRSINAPFKLGRPICKKCKALAAESGTEDAL